MQHTWTAARVLWKSLLSVLSSANHEVRSGFELRVTALLADISAGGGAVLDWLLESVVRGATQAEGARALAHLVAARMLLCLPTQKFHYFLSLPMKIVMKNLSMLTPTQELQIVHVSLQTLKFYLIFMPDYSFCCGPVTYMFYLVNWFLPCSIFQYEE